MHFLGYDVANGSSQRQLGSLLRSVRARNASMVLEMADEIGVVLKLNSGSAVRSRIDGRLSQFTLSAGDIVIHTPGQQIDNFVAGEIRVIKLAVPMGLARSIAAEDHGICQSRLEITPYHCAPDHMLRDLICQAAAQDEAEGEREVVRDIVAHLVSQHSTNKALAPTLWRGGLSSAKLRAVKTRVEDELLSITVADMAAEASLSPYHFAREFKRSVGETPWNYVVSRRINRAIELMGDIRFTLDEVAARAGFVSASHLGYRMRSRVNATPGRIRAALFI